MKTNITLLGLMAALFTLFPVAATSQEELCMECENLSGTCHQVCMPSSPDDEDAFHGATCRYAWDGRHGCLHCQWEGECGANQEDADFASVSVSPAGTVVGIESRRVRVVNDMVVAGCQQLVVGHVQSGTGHTTRPIARITL